MLLAATKVRKNWGIKAAIPLILVVGLGPQYIYYNVNVRMYSWMVFFVFGAALWAFDIMKTGSRKAWIWFVLFSLGGVYTQYFAVVPLFLLYFMVFMYLLVYARKKIWSFFLASVCTVLGYLPWLGVVWNTLQRDASEQKGIDSADLALNKLFKWAFQTHIVWSVYLPIILFVLCIGLLIGYWKTRKREENFFLCSMAALLFVANLCCTLLVQHMNHFWDYRYLLGAVIGFWMILCIMVAREKLFTWITFMIWIGITCLSSYTAMSATELDTVAWINAAKEVLAPLQEEKKIVYTFPTYDILYEYYLPDAEFIWYADVDFYEKETGSFYMIAWGGRDFDSSVKEERKVKENWSWKYQTGRGSDC